uniref:Uncharacterized protein n=1 Tax=Ditylenchus dipsaci TaxID=166011 RepID=A0A915DWF8_9BILA
MNISHTCSILFLVFGHLLWPAIAELQPSLDQILTFNAPGPWNFVFPEKDKWDSALVATLTADSAAYTTSKEVNIGFAKSVNGDRKAFFYDVLGSIWNATVSECLACEPTKNICESKPQCNLPSEILSNDAQTIGCILVLKRKEAQPLGIQPLTGNNPTTSVFHIQLPTKTSPTFNNSSVPVSADYYTGKRRKHHHKHHNAYPFSKIPVNAFMNDSIHSMNNSNTPANVPLDVNRIENNGSLLNKTTGESINPLQNQPFNGVSGTPPMISIKKRDVIQVPLSRDHYEKFLQINPSRHHYIEVIDLQFIEMLPDYANTELKFKDMAIELGETSC